MRTVSNVVHCVKTFLALINARKHISYSVKSGIPQFSSKGKKFTAPLNAGKNSCEYRAELVVDFGTACELNVEGSTTWAPALTARATAWIATIYIYTYIYTYIYIYIYILVCHPL